MNSMASLLAAYFGVILVALGAVLLVFGLLVLVDFRKWATRWARSVTQSRRSIRSNLPAALRPLLPDVGPSSGTLLGVVLMFMGLIIIAVAWSTISNAR